MFFFIIGNNRGQTTVFLFIKQLLVFEFSHPAWPPGFTRYRSPPQSRRYLYRKALITQRIIAVGRAADFIHQAWLQLITKSSR